MVKCGTKKNQIRTSFTQSSSCWKVTLSFDPIFFILWKVYSKTKGNTYKNYLFTNPICPAKERNNLT